MATARDLKLDSLTGDLAVESGDLVILSDADAIVQSIKIRMQFFKGEWFLDEDAGIPYWDSILVKNPDPNVLRTLFRKAILETPGVSALNSLEITIDRAERKLTISYSCNTDFGLLSQVEEL